MVNPATSGESTGASSSKGKKKVGTATPEARSPAASVTEDQQPGEGAEVSEGDAEESQNEHAEPPHYPMINNEHLSSDLASIRTGDPDDHLPYEAPDSSIPSGTWSSDYSTTNIPGLIGWEDARRKPKSKARFLQALRLGSMFRISELPDERATGRLTRSERNKPLIQRTLDILDALCLTFSVLYGQDGTIICCAPRADLMAALSIQIMMIKELYTPQLKKDGLPTFDKIVWGDEDNYKKWRSINDFEIFITNYRFDVENLLMHYAPYCSNKSDFEAHVGIQSPVSPSPATPEKSFRETTSVSEHPTRVKKTARFDRSSRLSYAPGDASGSAAMIKLLESNSSKHYGGGAWARESDNEGSNPFLTDRASASTREEASKRLSHRRSGPPDDPDDDSSDSSSNFGGYSRRGPPPPPRSNRRPGPVKVEPSNTQRHAFDKKLKANEVPAWDGNHDSLTRWMDRINSLAKLSPEVRKELGSVVPRRFTGDAEIWYWSIDPDTRDRYEESWDSLKAAIRGYFMNDQWLEKQRIRATSARFRDSTAPRELPTQYVVRKLNLINMVYNYTQTEQIRLIMQEAPTAWTPIVQPQFCKTMVDLQNAIAYHEENLIDASANYTRARNEGNSTARSSYQPYQRARSNLVGWSKDMPAPEFAKDDRTVSKKTPESIGARPCRHCGSGMHWDKECKHAKQGERKARSNLVQTGEEDLSLRFAQEEYDDLYYNADSDQDF